MNSVWSRLLGIMLLIVVPIAAVILIVAYLGFDAGVDNMRATQVAASEGRARTVFAWVDAAGRSLGNESVAAAWLGRERCDELATSFLHRNIGVSAVRFVGEGGAICAAGEPLDYSQLGKALSTPGEVGDGFRVAVVGSRLWIATDGPGETGESLNRSVVVFDVAALKKLLSPLKTIGEEAMALITSGGAVLTEDSTLQGGKWMPAAFPANGAQDGWRGLDGAGLDAAFVRTPLSAAGALFVLMRFDDDRLNAARRRLIVVSMSLLGMLTLLGFAYVATIRRDIVRWISGIETAARARSLDPESSAKAPVDSAMPLELRRVAETFNAMADRVLDRQHALKESLTENRALMLEMHHRIKNSLQVIQSYLALIRRSAARRSDVPALSRIEVRVAVLAVAYRLALTSNGMQPVSVKAFLDEITAGAVASLRRPRQRATLALDWNGKLDVDRAIPLGLALVEALIAAFDRIDAESISVSLNADQGAVELSVTSDGAQNENSPPAKILQGLAGQLGASAVARFSEDVLLWRFVA